MANWKYSIDIADAWRSASTEGDIKNLCNVLVKELEKIPYHDSQLKNIILKFKKFDDNTQDGNDFDIIMKKLYDWADFNNRLWIKTF